MGRSTPLPHEKLQAEYLRALRQGSGREADRVVEQALRAGLAAGDIYLDIFQPVAYEIGALWQRNEMTVAEEHLATAIIERQMSDLRGHFKPVRERGRSLLLGCADGELHRLGSRMVADFFEHDGWTVHYLAAAVPAASFVALAKKLQPDLIGISAQLFGHVDGIRDMVELLRAQGLANIPVLVGGLPFMRQVELSQTLGVHGGALNAADAVRNANALLESI